MDLAELCRRLEDPVGEVHALVELTQQPGVPLEQVSGVANRINNIYLELKQRGLPLLDSEERRVLVRKVAEVMSSHADVLDATDCSRLAWLYLHLRDEKRAAEAAMTGHQRDPNNDHCVRLLHRLS
jgi:hypothetical protein